MRNVVASSGLAIAVLTSPAIGDVDGVDYTRAPHWIAGYNDEEGGHSYQDLEVQDGHAYLAWGWALEIVDVSDPRHPTPLSKLAVPTGEVLLDEAVVYVGSAAGPFRAVDVFDPSSPEVIAELPDLHETRALAQVRPWLLAAIDDRDLVLIDVVDPLTPEIQFRWTGAVCNDVIGVGEHFVAVASTNGVWFLDVADPTNPVTVATTPSLGSTSRVVSSGDLVCASRADDEVVILDASDPGHPEELGRIPISDTFSLAIDGATLYVGGGDRLSAVDVTDPRHPVLRGALGLASYGAAIEPADDGLLYVADDPWGIAVFDPAEAVFIPPVGTVEIPPVTRAMAASETVACVAAHADSMLRILDLTDPSHPRLADSLATPAEIEALIVSGTIVFASLHRHGLDVIDVADPDHPERITTVALPGSPGEMIELDGHLLVAAGNEGVRIVDVTSPEDAHEVGDIPIPESAHTLVAAPPFLYVGTSHGVYEVVYHAPDDIPSVTGIPSTWDSAHHVVTGDYLFGIDEKVIQVVHRPTYEVTAIGETPPNWIHDMVRVGDDVYVLDLVRGVLLLDLSDPLDPAFVGGTGLAEWGHAIAAAGPNLVVAYDPVLAVLPAHGAPITPIEGPGDAGESPPVLHRVGRPIPSPTSSRATTPLGLDVPARVRAVVVDVAGREVTTLVDGVLPAGVHALRWPRGGELPGVYYLDVAVDGRHTGRRIVVSP